MLRVLIKKELLENILSLKFFISSILSLVLIITSISTLLNDYNRQLEEFDSASQFFKKAAEKMDSYERLAWEGLRISKPVSRLQIFISGIERNTPKTAWVSTYFENRLEGTLDKSPMEAFFPVVDLMYIIGIIMSLLAIVFSYDAISGEKERGTLKQILSNSVPRDTVILAKWIGNFLALLIPFLISILLGLIIILFSTNISFSFRDWLALALIILVSFLYLSAILSLGLWISTRTMRTATSITILLFIWTILTLIIPNLSPYLASIIYPIPSTQRIESEKTELSRAATREFHKQLDLMKKKNMGDEESKLRKKAMGELRISLNRGRQRIEEGYKNRLNKQIEIAKNISRLSPLSCAIYASTELAGTGIGGKERFLQALEIYTDQFTRYITRMQNSDIKWDPKGLDLKDLPHFYYAEEDRSTRIGNSLVDMLFLFLFNLFFFIGTYLSFLRYEVH